MPPARSYIERFWEKIEKTATCWLWRSSLDTHGYGQLGVARKTALAHRISWELHFGPIPTGLHVLHSCDNPRCVNPAHLRLGTNQDNVDDRLQRGRQTYGDAHHTTKYSSTFVEEIRQARAAGKSMRAVAAAFGVSPGYVSDVVHRKRRAWG